MPGHPLSSAEVDRFLDEGHLILRDCFSRDAAADLVADAYRQLGYKPGEPSTWEKPLAFLYPSTPVSLTDLAPRAWDAICQLIGGAGRAAQPYCPVGQWVINFHRGRDEPWRPPAEQGLLVIPIFSDIEPRGGGTLLACDSVPVVARFLRDHPEGVRLDEIDFPALVARCRDFREVTGRAGDVVLVHPFMLHNFSQNQCGRPRFITNVCVSLSAPMGFHRDDPRDYSPVERAILRGLGVPYLDFRPTAPRERIDPGSLKDA